MDLTYLNIESLWLPALTLILGFVLGKMGKTKKPQASSLSNSSDLKLNNEVLEDQVKQLEAKIKTLEKALEISNK